MNSFLGIEMTDHQAFVLLGVLASISTIVFICGAAMHLWGERKSKYDYAICGCWLQVFGGLGVIVFTSLAQCFK